MMAECWVESIAVTGAGSRASWMTVKLVSAIAKNWIDEMVG